VADSWVQSRANRLSRLLAEPVEELDGGEPDFLQSEPDGHLWVQSQEFQPVDADRKWTVQVP
jgi:hypothetical protein